MPGMTAEQLSVAPTCLHAPSAAGGLWDCALLGKLARGVLAIERLPGAAAPNRGPSCTLQAQCGFSHGRLGHRQRCICISRHSDTQYLVDLQACTTSTSIIQARCSISYSQTGMNTIILTVQLTWSPQAGWSSLAGCVPQCPAHVQAEHLPWACLAAAAPAGNTYCYCSCSL